MKLCPCCLAPSVVFKLFSFLPIKGLWEESGQLIHTKM